MIESLCCGTLIQIENSSLRNQRNIKPPSSHKIRQASSSIYSGGQMFFFIFLLYASIVTAQDTRIGRVQHPFGVNQGEVGVYYSALAQTQRDKDVGQFCGEWAVKFKCSNVDECLVIANQIASSYDLVILGQVSHLTGVYYLTLRSECDPTVPSIKCHKRRHNRSPRNHALHGELSGHDQVLWVEQQALVRRRHRLLGDDDDHQFSTRQVAYNFVGPLTHTRVSARAQDGRPVGRYEVVYGNEVLTVDMDRELDTDVQKNSRDDESMKRRAIVQPSIDSIADLFIDPLWSKQWYLHGDDKFPSSNVNVKSVWERNITGRGVVVCIVDDGLEHTHPDLQGNYNSSASLDVNGDDDDPLPRYTQSNINKHGTRCAGEVAAIANNSHCTVGLAYHAQVGGIRMLDGPITDVVEARALGHAPQIIDIYTNSWGPDDDGVTMEQPGQLVQETLFKGVREGRAGKGSLFIFASGNGMRRDNCNADGYANSVYTIALGAVDRKLQWPWYAEPCTAQLAVTFSSNEHDFIATTDLRRTCTTRHSGTSAAAPLGAGILALVLSANNTLTWRDIQYLVVYNSVLINPDDDSWVPNRKGLLYSHKYGFGLMDAHAIVGAAEVWKGVRGPQLNHTHVCVCVDIRLGERTGLWDEHQSKQQTTSTFAATVTNKDIKNSTHSPSLAVKPVTDGQSYGCVNESVVWSVFYAEPMNVKYVEHITVKVNLAIDERGVLEVFLQSPCGTISQLLTRRIKDKHHEGLIDWTFMTVAFWGENPEGRWLLWVTTHSDQKDYLTQPGQPIQPKPYYAHNGTFVNWQLTVWGTNQPCTPPYCDHADLTGNPVCKFPKWPDALLDIDKEEYDPILYVAIGLLIAAAAVLAIFSVCLVCLRTPRLHLMVINDCPVSSFVALHSTLSDEGSEARPLSCENEDKDHHHDEIEMEMLEGSQVNL